MVKTALVGRKESCNWLEQNAPIEGVLWCFLQNPRSWLPGLRWEAWEIQPGLRKSIQGSEGCQLPLLLHPNFPWLQAATFSSLENKMTTNNADNSMLKMKREAHVTLWDKLETWGEREVVLAGYGCHMQAKPLPTEDSILWEHSPTCSTVGEWMCLWSFWEPVVPAPGEHTFCLQMHLPGGWHELVPHNLWVPSQGKLESHQATF